MGLVNWLIGLWRGYLVESGCKGCVCWLPWTGVLAAITPKQQGVNEPATLLQPVPCTRTGTQTMDPRSRRRGINHQQRHLALGTQHSPA